MNRWQIQLHIHHTSRKWTELNVIGLPNPPTDQMSNCHFQLGHLLYDAIDKLSKEGVSNVRGKITNLKGASCIKGKMSRLPFHSKTENTRALQPGEIFYSDVYGLFEMRSRGSRFFPLLLKPIQDNLSASLGEKVRCSIKIQAIGLLAWN